MLFSSVTFLFLFLPVVIIGYYILPKKLRNTFLLIASIIFYAWGEPKYLPIIFTTITISYFGALAVEKFKFKKILLTLFVLLDLSLLFYFKYTNFFLENLDLIFHQKWSLKVVLPLGISFYTFQALSYLVDVYRGQVKAQKSYLKIALYICLFPQLIAGPIVKYHDVSDQIDNREETIDKVYYGIRRFIIGLAKKVLIANTLGGVADKVFAQDPSEFGSGIAWLGAISYALQLYYDFSGYSDMAIGLGSIFGFKFLENFNYPFISKSITEYWRRWHISLGTWFRDYLYFPLGGSKKGLIRKNINILIVFFCVGIWHGATWTLVFSGLYNGILLVFENLTKINQKEYRTCSIGNFCQRTYALVAILMGTILFRSETLIYTKNFLLNLFGLFQVQDAFPFLYYVDRITIMIFLTALICCTPIFKNMLNWDKNWKIIQLGVDVWLIILFFLSCMQLVATTYNPFVYFRF